MTIKDIGPTPQSFDIEDATKDNTDYRSVAWSSRYLRLTLMSIPVGGDIGLEAHPETDQFLRLDAGRGRTQMGPPKDELAFEEEVSDGCCAPQHADTHHASSASSGLSPSRRCMTMIVSGSLAIAEIVKALAARAVPRRRVPRRREARCERFKCRAT